MSSTGFALRRTFVEIVDSHRGAVGIHHFAVVRREWKIRQVGESCFRSSQNLQSAPLTKPVGPIDVLVIWTSRTSDLVNSLEARTPSGASRPIDASKSIRAPSTESRASAARRPCRADAQVGVCRTRKLFPPRSARARGTTAYGSRERSRAKRDDQIDDSKRELLDSHHGEQKHDCLARMAKVEARDSLPRRRRAGTCECCRETDSRYRPVPPRPTRAAPRSASISMTPFIGLRAPFPMAVRRDGSTPAAAASRSSEPCRRVST